MADESKKRGPRKKYITQPCRLPLGNGNFAEVTIRVPQESAELVRWEFTNESVLIMTAAARTIDAPLKFNVPKQYAAAQQTVPARDEDDEDDEEIRQAIERGASEQDVEAILAARNASAPALRLASDRGAEIARAAAGLRTIKVTVDGEDVEQELSSSGGLAR